MQQLEPATMPARNARNLTQAVTTVPTVALHKAMVGFTRDTLVSMPVAA